MDRASFMTGLKTGRVNRRRKQAAEPARPALSEHAMVVLSSPFELDDGRTLPAGARGAIVYVHGGGAACMIEFVHPMHAVVIVPSINLSHAPTAA